MSDYHSVFHLKIIIKDGSGPVAKRLEVPDRYNFRQLHTALQNALNLQEYNRYKFILKHIPTRKLYQIGPDYADSSVESDEIHFLCDVYIHFNMSVFYVNEFDPDWLNLVSLEKIQPRIEGVEYPLVLEGTEPTTEKDGSYWFILPNRMSKNPFERWWF